MLTTEDLNESAICSIAQLTDQAKGADGKVVILPIPSHPEAAFLIVKPDGSYETKSMPLGPRGSTLFSVDQVPPYVNSAVDRWEAHPSVYYNEQQVYCRLADNDLIPERGGSVKVDLKKSPQFQLLETFSKNRDAAWKTHKAFMLMLRIDFETNIDPFALEQTIKACEAYSIDETGQTRSTVTRNRESLGNDIKSELRAGAGEIPEQLIMRVRVFRDPALLTTRQIVCKLETDPTNGGRFAVLPLADEIDNAMDAEMRDLGDLLRSSVNPGKILTDETAAAAKSETKKRQFVPVFYGSF